MMIVLSMHRDASLKRASHARGKRVTGMYSRERGLYRMLLYFVECNLFSLVVVSHGFRLLFFGSLVFRVYGDEQCMSRENLFFSTFSRAMTNLSRIHIQGTSRRGTLVPLLQLR